MLRPAASRSGMINQRRSTYPDREPVQTTGATSEVQQMKERIQVLERVITDNHKSVDLDREIERLRDR
ncbi:hypothetical protein [Sphingomonas sp. ZB1N12]|uniref:hypothetical protein n=1 Tax=Sphingomonas arabinosi TaxID=3096160 RepID=UPI003FA72B9B